MFTDLSALFALIGTANGDRSVSVYVDDPPRPTPSGNASAGSISARPLNRVARSLERGAQGKAKPPRDTVKSGVTVAIGDRRNPRIPVFKALRDCAAAQHIAASDRPLGPES